MGSLTLDICVYPVFAVSMISRFERLGLLPPANYNGFLIVVSFPDHPVALMHLDPQTFQC
jgi:hypothetical protein